MNFRSSQVKSGQVRSSQVKSGQVRSCHVRLLFLPEICKNTLDLFSLCLRSSNIYTEQPNQHQGRSLKKYGLGSRRRKPDGWLELVKSCTLPWRGARRCGGGASRSGVPVSLAWHP